MRMFENFEDRLTARMTGICFIGDPNDFDGWDSSNNGNPGGGGHQGNGGDGSGWGDPTQQRADAGNGYAPDGGYPSYNKPGVGGTNNRTGKSSGGESENEDTSLAEDLATNAMTSLLCGSVCSGAVIPPVVFGCAVLCSTTISRGDGDIPPDHPNSSQSPIKFIPDQNPLPPTLPTHPSYKTTGYAIDGYDRIFMYGDHTHYSISGLTKVTGYQSPSGKELVKWYGTTYAIPDAAARRRRFG